ncbi:DUF4328 domain-containing protein, partial [Streptomyces sp. MBT57]|nr:DUF4328 domain-containing protein [Streptomyces sp. MBT57]
ADQITDRRTGSLAGPDGLGLVAAADVLEIVAAVVALLFVRALTRMQVERAAQPPVPAPAVPGAHR